MTGASLLRPGILDGITVTHAAASPGEHGRAAAGACAALGAAVSELRVDPAGDAPEAAPADVLVWDGAGAFAARSGVEAVRDCLDGAWLALRAGTRLEGGKAVLIAPPAGDEHAAGARAGIENLARTLSIEWSRFGVRIVAVLPGAPEAAGQVVAYLASRAGDYFSGTALELR